MKNKLYKGLLIIFAIFVVLLPVTIATADSGWGSSYHSSGGSSHHSSGGSSHYSSSSSHRSSSSSHSSSSGEPLTPLETGILVFFLLFILSLFVISFIGIVSVFNDDVKKSKGKIDTHINIMTQDRVDKIDPSINIEKTLKEVFDLFTKVQDAWSEFKYDELRKYLSDELFNNYKMQLETLELEDGKNVMGDYKYISGGIISIDKKKDLEELRVKLHVEMKDYVINTKTNKVTHGEKNGIMDNTYIITLERSLNNEITNCPDCGAEIKDQASQKCEYCDAILVKGPGKFVMVKKETIKSGYK